MAAKERPERVVCAAIRWEDIVILGVRHFDKFMQEDLELLGSIRHSKWEQGFVTSHCRFVDRMEAWTIAKACGQLPPEAQSRLKPELRSEDLY